MECYNIVANYTGHLTFMWSRKFNNNSPESYGIFIIKQSGNPGDVGYLYHGVYSIGLFSCIY